MLIFKISFICFLIIYVTLAKDTEDINIENYEYDGALGLVDHTKAVCKKFKSEVKNFGANMGVALGGLSTNVAYQLTNRVSKEIERGKRVMKGALEQVRKAGKLIVKVADRTVYRMGRLISRPLEFLANCLDKVSKNERLKVANKMKGSDTDNHHQDDV